jgi:hypothetical protein
VKLVDGLDLCRNFLSPLPKRLRYKCHAGWITAGLRPQLADLSCRSCRPDAGVGAELVVIIGITT